MECSVRNIAVAVATPREGVGYEWRNVPREHPALQLSGMKAEKIRAPVKMFLKEHWFERLWLRGGLTPCSRQSPTYDHGWDDIEHQTGCSPPLLARLGHLVTLEVLAISGAVRRLIRSGCESLGWEMLLTIRISATACEPGLAGNHRSARPGDLTEPAARRLREEWSRSARRHEG